MKLLPGKLHINSFTGRSIGVLLLRTLGVGLFFLGTLYLTNELSPDLVGQYDYSRALLLFVGAVALFGMQQSVIFYSGLYSAQNNLGQIRQVYKMMFLLVIALSIGLNILLYALGPIITALGFKPLSALVYQTFTGILFYALTMLNIDVLRAIDKIYISELLRNIFRYLIFFLGVVALVYLDQPQWLVSVFLGSFVLLAVMSSLFLLYYFSQSPLREFQPAARISPKAILKRSAPMAISAASFLLMQSLDVLMLKQFENYTTVAVYSVAVKLTLLLSVALASVNAVLAPKIAEDYNRGAIKALAEKVKKSTRLIFFSTAPAIVILALGAEWILSWFGPAYTAAKTPLLILLVGQGINTLCGSVGVYLNMTSKQKIFQWIVASALVLNVALNIYLIPIYGINGAAWATASSMMAWNIIAVIYVYKSDGIKTFLTW
jgi:O-antigen/teichoic acid export membrane protein